MYDRGIADENDRNEKNHGKLFSNSNRLKNGREESEKNNIETKLNLTKYLSNP